jgi:hypothetical protein
VIQPVDRIELLRLAAKYVWSTPPEVVANGDLSGLVASVMEIGTWEDAHELLELVGPSPFIEVLRAPPPGSVCDRSLAFWHARLRQQGGPPRAPRRFS